MKAKVKVEKEVEIKTMQVSAGVRYWEDASVDGVDDEQGDLIPCRDGDSWTPIINVDSGKILNWTQGVTAEVHYKVCDQCSWELLDASGNVIKSVKDEYVPDTLCPKEEGYGDYIIMDVDANGMIANWKFELADLDLEEVDED